MFVMRNGPDQCRRSYPLKKWAVFPGYVEKSNMGSGRDIAIATYDGSDDPEFESTTCTDMCWGPAETLQVGTNYRVAGYPAEHGGYLYSMDGHIAKVQDVGDGLKVVCYNDLDTTGGQSGSPFCEISKHDMKITRGVHIGTDFNTNMATLITPTVEGWMRQMGAHLTTL